MVLTHNIIFAHPLLATSAGIMVKSLVRREVKEPWSDTLRLGILRPAFLLASLVLTGPSALSTSASLRGRRRHWIFCFSITLFYHHLPHTVWEQGPWSVCFPSLPLWGNTCPVAQWFPSCGEERDTWCPGPIRTCGNLRRMYLPAASDWLVTHFWKSLR